MNIVLQSYFILFRFHSCGKVAPREPLGSLASLLRNLTERLSVAVLKQKQAFFANHKSLLNKKALKEKVRRSF